MSIVENHLKRKLEAGGLAISLNLLHWRSVNAAGLAEACAFDWLFIDMEHSTTDLDTAAAICVAALTTSITPIVRVASHDSFQTTRLLDGGAMGVVVPHVETPEDARHIVSFCRYPPLGHRSLTAPAPQLGFATVPPREAIEILNRNTLVIVQIESPRAIDNADAIAAVPGVDGLMIGTNDLAAEMGIAGDFANPRITEAYERVVAACRRHGKHPGMGGVYNHDLMEKFIRIGARLVLGGSDVALMTEAGRARTAFLRNLQI